MKRAFLALAVALFAFTLIAPAVDAKKPSQQESSSLITKGMTLDQVEQAIGGSATPAGAPRNGVQEYRISYRPPGDANDHPAVTVYLFGLKDGKVVWVHKQK